MTVHFKCVSSGFGPVKGVHIRGVVHISGVSTIKGLRYVMNERDIVLD